MKSEKLWTTFLTLLLSVFPLFSADKLLAPGHVPAAVARARLVPIGRVAATNQMHITLGLPLRDRAALTNLLAQIYDPASPEFHHYLTPAQFTARFGPTPADYQSVIHFAVTNGLKVVATRPNRMLLDVSGAAANVERAFHVRLMNFRHPTEQRNFFAPDTEPTVDARLPIQDVGGLDNYSRPRPRLHLRGPTAKVAAPRYGSAPGYGGFIGADFRNAYVPGSALAGSGQSIGLFQLDGYDPNDITNYEQTAGLTNNVPLQNVLLDGYDGHAGGNNIEVCLDIEMSISMAPALASVIVYEANPETFLPNDVLNQMAVDNLAKQLSCSWGWGGGPNATTDQIFQEMAAQGQSFFAAAGDTDAFAPGALDDPLQENSPADNPFLTSVGGTSLATSDVDGSWISETVWNWHEGHGSGGGSSSYHEIPFWQLGISMATNGGSPTHRNIPDVALVADNVYVQYNSGSSGTVGGTSCASPLWAAFTALMNQQAAQLGQPPVGFLNPAIYALNRGTNYLAAFHDITNGDNTSYSSPTNYYAVAGYDLCTGWGTPQGTNLINLLSTPDGLGVYPATNFLVTGPVGGPFSATNWIVNLTNTGDTSLDWALGGTPFWLTTATNGGTLAAHDSIALTFCLSGVEAFSAGNYLATLELTNQTLGRVQTFSLTLVVGQTIVQNGGFETGDFTGWTLVGDTIIGNLIYNVVATEADFDGIVHSGNYGAFLGQGGYAATLSQTLATTPGQLHLFSFWLHNPEAGTNQFFAASWDGNTLVNITNPPAFDWTNFQFLVSATDTNTVLQFAAENDPNYFGFDDVSVTPVPPVAFGNLTPTNGNLLLAWNSLAGLNYQIQYTTDLTQTNWQVLATLTAATNVSTFLETNLSGPDPQRFYRLVLSP